MADTSLSVNNTLPTGAAGQDITTANSGDETVIDVDGATEVDDEGDDDESDCSDETDMSEDVVDVWEQEGILHCHKEGSYLEGVKRPQYWLPDRRIINYDDCKSGELKRFVNDRLLQDPFPTGITLKYFYIRTLEKADRLWNFRLMDLPPEMRLLVFRNLLAFPVDFCDGDWDDGRGVLYYDGYCEEPNLYPAILGTCKQIHEEAKGILYTENIFSVSYSVSAGDQWNLARDARVHNYHRRARCAHAEYFRIPQGIDDYPEFLRRITRLEISLTYAITAERVIADGYWPLNHYLYALASFLMDGHRLKSLHLMVDLSSEVEEYAYETILFPLRRLRNVPSVTISGDVPAYVRTKLMADLSSGEPTFNTMRHWKLLTDEARAQLSIHEAMHEDVHCICGECPVPACIEELSHILYSLEEAKEESCFNSCLEENFMARLAMLQSQLMRVKVTDVEVLVKNLIEKRAALTAYEAVSDDGRLREAAKTWGGNVFNDAMKYGADDDWSVDLSDTAIEEAIADAAEDKQPSPQRGDSIQEGADHSGATVGPEGPSASIAGPSKPQLADETSSDTINDIVERAIRGAVGRVSPELL